MKKLVTGLTAKAALTMTTLVAAPLAAQEGSGLRGTLSFSQGLEASDNPSLVSDPDGTTITSRTNLGFKLTSETRTEQFQFGVDARFDNVLSGDDSDDDGITSRGANLSYGRQGANSELSFFASYREADLDDETFGFFVDGEFDPDALVIDGGSRRLTSFGGRLEFGREGPFGITVSARASQTDYVDAIDPDLIDTDRTSVDARARFRINPSLTTFVTAGTSEEVEADTLEITRTNQYVGAGVAGEIRTGLTYSTQITLDKSETTVGDSVDSEDDGVGIELKITQEQADGSLSFGASSRIDDAGRLTTASVGRSFDLPLGSLSLSLGLADRDSEDTQVTAGLSYLRETPNGALTASLVQRPGTDDGDATLNTDLSVSFSQELSPVSGWDASLSYSALSPFSSGSGDNRTSASIAYNRELTQDWGLRTGLRHSRISEDGGDSRSSNTLFLNIERDITFGF